MTDAELAVLSLVGQEPRHGYEIEQVIEARGMRDWTAIGFSSIYYLLKKLEGEGLMEGRLEKAERGPARKVFHITPAGREALHSALLDVLSVPVACHSRLLLGVSNLPGVAPGEAVAALQQYHGTLLTRQEELRARWQSQRPLPYFVDALFDHSLTMIQAEADWVQTFMAQVQAEPQAEGE